MTILILRKHSCHFSALELISIHFCSHFVVFHRHFFIDCYIPTRNFLCNNGDCLLLLVLIMLPIVKVIFRISWQFARIFHRLHLLDNSTSHNKPKKSEETIYVDKTLIRDIIAQANGDKNEHVVIQN